MIKTPPYPHTMNKPRKYDPELNSPSSEEAHFQAVKRKLEHEENIMQSVMDYFQIDKNTDKCSQYLELATALLHRHIPAMKDETNRKSGAPLKWTTIYKKSLVMEVAATKKSKPKLSILAICRIICRRQQEQQIYPLAKVNNPETLKNVFSKAKKEFSGLYESINQK